jgi:hypothetical protein
MSHVSVVSVGEENCSRNWTPSRGNVSAVIVQQDTKGKRTSISYVLL